MEYFYRFRRLQMSFPEFLRERISEDYKNLIIQKLDEIKTQTENLKEALSPSLFQSNQAIKENVQREIARVQEALDAELSAAQQRAASHLDSVLQDYQSSWFYSDISAFQQQVEMLISDIITNIPVPPKKENEELASLTALMNKLDQGNTQAEILNIVLQHISEWVDRAVLFVVKGSQATGWIALGLGPDWDAARIRSAAVDLNKNTVLREVTSTGAAAYGSADQFADNAELFQLIGTTTPGAALAFPVMVRGKIAGVLYADTAAGLEEKPDLPNLLLLASRSAGAAIDLLPMKPKQAAAPAVAAPAPQPAAKTVPPAAPAPAPPPPPPPPAPPTQMLPVVDVAPEEEVDSAAGTVMMPAVKPPAAPVSDEDQKLHEDAKRFARLLVSEIKLYNEAQVSAGREKRDLYDRLKDDIERSRRMYTERVPQNIQNASNYFYEELVRTLANGDPTLLGM